MVLFVLNAITTDINGAIPVYRVLLYPSRTKDET